MLTPRRRKILMGLLGSLFVVWLILGYIASYFFVRPMPRSVNEREEIAGRPVENIELEAQDGVRIRGWYVEGDGKGAVVLMNGIYSTRSGMVSRAEWYLDRGYSALLPDLRGTGLSEGNMVSYGWYERYDLAASYAFLRERAYERVAAHGISLGAATIAYSLPEINSYEFVVLESSYDTLENAYRNRLAMVGVPHFITYPVRWFVQWRLGVRTHILSPMDHLQACSVPALIMAGDAEVELKLEETQALYEACGSEQKRLHIFRDGRHENFHRRYKEEFESVLEDFVREVESGWRSDGLLADAA